MPSLVKSESVWSQKSFEVKTSTTGEDKRTGSFQQRPGSPSDPPPHPLIPGPGCSACSLTHSQAVRPETTLFHQYSCVYCNEKLPNNINIAKLGTTFCQILNNPQKVAQRLFLNTQNFGQSGNRACTRACGCVCVCGGNQPLCQTDL